MDSDDAILEVVRRALDGTIIRWPGPLGFKRPEGFGEITCQASVRYRFSNSPGSKPERYVELDTIGKGTSDGHTTQRYRLSLTQVDRPYWARPEVEINPGLQAPAERTDMLQVIARVADRAGAHALATGVLLQRQALLAICREFIADLEVVGLEHVREDWPDLGSTYDKAKAALGELWAETDQAAEDQEPQEADDGKGG